MSKSIISICENKNEISRSIKKIYTNKFLKSFKNQKEHYKKDKTSRKIIKELNKFNIFEMEAKKFYDILI